MTLESLPDVYIDTDVAVNAIISDMENTAASRAALETLLKSENVVHFSIILRMEYAQAIRNLASRGQLPTELRKGFHLDNWSDPVVRTQWMQYGMGQLDTLINDLPTVVELPVSGTIISQASEYMARYALRSQDAVHLATALHYEIPVFWTCDDHFSRVDDLVIEIIREAA